MFTPDFTYTDSLVRNLMQIQGAKEVIENSPILPVWQFRLQKDALIRQTYHTTRIAGTQLTIEQIKNLFEGEPIVARERDKQEALNYLKVVDFINAVYNEPEMVIDLRTIRHLHLLIFEGLEESDEVGQFRRAQNWVKSSKTKEVIYTPPLPSDVPELMREFVDWLSSEAANQLSPLLKAGIAHYQLVIIHPFFDGNGRTARALANLILYQANYDIKKLFSLEEYYDINPSDYSTSLQGELTTWLEYFTAGIAEEMQKIKEQVLIHSRDRALRDRIGQVKLSPRQLTILSYVEKNGRITNRELQALSHLSHTSAYKELMILVKSGVLKKEGKGRGTHYLLVDDF